MFTSHHVNDITSGDMETVANLNDREKEGLIKLIFAKKVLTMKGNNSAKATSSDIIGQTAK